MRLSEKEVKLIKTTVLDIFTDAQLYLFGSRLDDAKKGGDIDLFIISKDATFTNKIKALAKLKRLLHKPVDLVLHKDFSREIEKEALKGIRII